MKDTKCSNKQYTTLLCAILHLVMILNRAIKPKGKHGNDTANIILLPKLATLMSKVAHCQT